MQEALDLSPEAAMTDRHPDQDFQYHTSSTCTVSISIATRGNIGWTLADLGKLIALLELQRSMLADEPLDVRVTVSSPTPRERLNPSENPVNEVKRLTEVINANSAQ